MLERYIAEGALRFHMPGHKGLADLPGVSHDVTEVPGTDALFDAAEGIREAQAAAARAWRAGASFLLVNGSTAGVQAMILWAKAQGRQLVLPRDCHDSAVHACALADIQPVWAEPCWDAREQLATQFGGGLPSFEPGGVTAVFATYPDYYGRCSDLSALKARFGGHGAALLADAAHGAHFAFSPKLPPDAGEWADMWVCGAHKTLPAPTQSAFLHLMRAEDAPAVLRLLRGVSTTSPSYLLMEGLDDARARMEESRARLDGLIGDCARLTGSMNALDGLRCWREADVLAMGCAAYDPTRIVADVRGLGITGWEAGARLRGLGLQAEMCDICRVVLIATIMDGPERLQGVLEAFTKLAKAGKAGTPVQGLGALPARGEAAMTLRQAWLAEAEEAQLADCIGRVAAEPFGAYPPGMPLCMPGEVITADAVNAALQVRAMGGMLFGAGDGKIAVIK